MGQEQPFDRRRCHLESLDLDELLETVAHEEVSRCIDMAEVACPEEAVAAHDLSGCVRPIEVAEHHLRPLDAHFARLANSERRASLGVCHLEVGARQGASY